MNKYEELVDDVLNAAISWEQNQCLDHSKALSKAVQAQLDEAVEVSVRLLEMRGLR